MFQVGTRLKDCELLFQEISAKGTPFMPEWKQLFAVISYFVRHIWLSAEGRFQWGSLLFGWISRSTSLPLIYLFQCPGILPCLTKSVHAAAKSFSGKLCSEKTVTTHSAAFSYHTASVIKYFKYRIISYQNYCGHPDNHLAGRGRCNYDAFDEIISK